ncbi:MAG: metallophosphoesterase [Bdellovibrionota bacterium]
MSKFFIILITLMLYTALKAVQIWPNHRWLAASLTIPFFVAMIGWNFLYRSDPAIFNSLWFEIAAWTGGIIMGAWAAFVLFSIPLDLIGFLVGAYKKITSETHDPARREFISRSVHFSVMGAAGAIAGLGLIEVFRGSRVKKVSISVPNLASSLQGLKIAQISDLHVGPTIRKGYVDDVVDQTNALDPDLIFVTGDLADGKMDALAEHMAPLGRLKSKYGIYYVTGNHEYYWGVNDFLASTSTLGFIPLVNENKIIDIQGGKLMIAGIPDVVGSQFFPTHSIDLRKAMESNEKIDLKILLSHRPDTIIDAEPLGYDLQFSGHTHSGQFFPFSLLVPLVHKYYRGLNQHGRMQVYVNPGTGYWGPANRFTIPSEITAITLEIAHEKSQG